MPRLIELLKGRSLPVRVTTGGGDFEITHYERESYFGFWCTDDQPDGYYETDEGWELCPDQPAANSYQDDCYPKPDIPMEEERPGFRKVKMYTRVSKVGNNPPLYDTGLIFEDLHTASARGFGHIEVDVWMKE